MDGATNGLPGAAGHAAHDSLAGASAVADKLGGAAGQALHHTANVAFIEGMQIAMLAGAAVTAAGALIALVLLPSRQSAGEAAAKPAVAAAARTIEPVAVPSPA